MRIIRQKLDGGTTFPKNLRYNTVTDTVEQTYDNGETWVENENANPRTSTALIHATPSRDTICETAANVRAFLQANIAQVVEVLSQFDGAAGVVGALVTILIAAFLKLGPFGIIVALFFALASYLVGIGKTAIEYAFIADEWDIILCNIYESTPSDGIYDQMLLDEIVAKNAATLNTTAAGIINGMLLLMGFVGLTNAGKTGTETAECGDCGWCWNADSTTDLETTWSMYVKGTWDGSKWVGVNSTLGSSGGAYNNSVAPKIEYLLSLNITHIEIYVTLAKGTSGIGCDLTIYDDLLPSPHVLQAFSNQCGTNRVFTWTGSIDVDTLAFWVNGGRSVSPGTGSATAIAYVHAIKIEGRGVNPFSGVNC